MVASPVYALPPEQESTPETEIRYCAECHRNYRADWETGGHATAFTNEIFQSTWIDQRLDSTCLSCHTTNYNPNTGEYFAENVQCEACHGVTPDDHPENEFIVTASAETCADCHNSTFNEWRASSHAVLETGESVGCETCHDPHGQTLVAETVTALCNDCHLDIEAIDADGNTLANYTELYVHTSHEGAMLGEEEVGCVDCHMSDMSDDGIHQIADHSMNTPTTPCTECHEAVALASGETALISDVDHDETVEDGVAGEDGPEVILTESELQSPPDTTGSLLQGLILGIGLGITFWLVLRGRQG